MVEVIALKPIHRTPKGGRLRVQRQEARVLIALGMAVMADSEAKPAPVIEVVEPPKPKRVYRRRNMVAEPTYESMAVYDTGVIEVRVTGAVADSTE
jgi:hypothetical protein